MFNAPLHRETAFDMLGRPKQSRTPREGPTFLREMELWNDGYRRVAGVDEAGRGPLAGPVVAAAVILSPGLDPHILAGIRDSKQLGEAARERFYDILIRHAEAYSIAQSTPREIETLDIRQASLLAMRRALENLDPRPEYVLVDGRDYPAIDIPGEAIVKGDQRSVLIGAASILAKVTRDRMMLAWHENFPHYGFDHHKGYPTEFHRVALELFGRCALHRKTFRWVPDYGHTLDLSPAFQSALQRGRGFQRVEEVEELLEELSAVPLNAKERYYLEQWLLFQAENLRRRARDECPANVDRGGAHETLAIEFLTRKGYRLWERNYHCRGGEIDLIMNQGTRIVFIEVKSRSSSKFGMPYEAVTPRKRKAIIQAAEKYLYDRGLGDGWDIRYDVVSILAPRGRTPMIEHFEDAFRVEEELG
ncbi:MAG TPA: ribonuclease HII [bacterium]|nr:ribonuclease HII [bacterium]